MKKILLGLLLIIATAGADELMTAKQANNMTTGTLEASYIADKSECDKAMKFANQKINEAADATQFATVVSLGFYNCRISVLKYLIIKKGYNLQISADNRFIISW